MRAAVLGGGPGGLYFAISLKLRDPAHEVVVIERNRPDDTFGWGVVLSDETLANLELNDPRKRRADPRTPSPIGTTSPCITAARWCARAATVFAASRASVCSTFCRNAPARSASSCASRPRSPTSSSSRITT